MNNYTFKKCFIFICLLTFSIIYSVYCDNPIIRTIRTADPSAHVWADGKMWLYCSHDQDNATDYSSMDGYHVFSSSDLVNWTDHGEVLHSKNVSWGSAGWMWAPDCAFHNGIYYFYFPHKDKSGSWKTGVATSAKPEGPFKDVGKPIDGARGIDPACFIDDDGTAYLYMSDFGNPLVAKLKSNMIELAETPKKIVYGSTNFQEGVWMHKRNGIYYFSYTRWQSPDNGGLYATGDNPYGPFTYRGLVSPGPSGAQDHHSIVKYYNSWYYFYHIGNYNGGSGNRRNVCIDYLYYNQDGTMKMVKQTSNGVIPVQISIVLDNKINKHYVTPLNYISNDPIIFTLQGRKITNCNTSALMTGAHNLGSQIVIIRDTRVINTSYSIHISH